MRIDNDLPDLFTLDLWPFGPSFLMSASPAIYEQYMISRDAPKPAMLVETLEPIGGKANLVLDNGARHRRWRSAFNPGFSNAHLTTLVPEIVDAVSTFRQKMLKNAASHQLFRMTHDTTRLTIDIICKVVM